MDRLRVMKCLFVLSKKFQIHGEYYQFRPYNYGPFDDRVYRDAEELAANGIIEQRPGRYASYSANPPAIARAIELSPTLNNEFVKYLREVRTWANSVDFSTLVKAIYQAWPEMRANSVFQR